MKTAILTTLAVLSLVGVIIGLTEFNLGFKERYDVKYKDVDRKTYESTKSFVHGKTQDLARLFEEHSKSDDSSKKAVVEMVKIQFADFNESQIRNEKLRSFLVEARGY